MSSNEILAIGNLLISYAKELEYIAHFEDWRNGVLNDEEMKLKLEKFLKEFKFASSISINNRDRFYDQTFYFLRSDLYTSTISDVGTMVNHYRENNVVSRNAISLASKILFIFNPLVIFPFERFAERALSKAFGEITSYSDYYEMLLRYKTEMRFQDSVNKVNDYVSHLVAKIEDPYTWIINRNNFDEFRKNRIAFKLLLIIGRNL